MGIYCSPSLIKMDRKGDEEPWSFCCVFRNNILLYFAIDLAIFGVQSSLLRSKYMIFSVEMTKGKEKRRGGGDRFSYERYRLKWLYVVGLQQLVCIKGTICSFLI